MTEENTAPKPSAFRKNWDTLATQALDKEGKEKSLSEDPNVGGDAAVNSFFQQIYGNADEETRRAMLKSYTESGGTALSTDWKEVSLIHSLSLSIHANLMLFRFQKDLYVGAIILL